MVQLDKDLLTWLKEKFYTKTDTDTKLAQKSDLTHTHQSDTVLNTESTNAVQNKVITTELNNKAPNNHASTSNTYGEASNTNYGHVKLDSSLSSTSTNPLQNKIVYNELNKKSDTSHTHNSLSSTIILSGTNLNNLTTVGEYYCNNNTIAASLSNCPVNIAFHLSVIQHAGIRQILKTYATNNTRTYERNYYNNSWGAWYLTYTEETLNTTNGLMTNTEKTKLAGIKEGATKNIIDTALSTSSTNAVQNKLITTALNGKAPNGHASTSNTYGLGSTSNYGHVKTINSLTQSSHSDGTALSAYQGKILKDLVDSKSSSGHTHTGTELRLGSSGNDANVTIQEAVNNKSASNHTHGNITNAGAIGSTANLPVITTTSGKLTTGSFGTAANTFCQGNDSRLSDTRTPKSHATSANTYGLGSTSNYGHVKTINNLTQSSHSDGTALSAYQGKILNDKIDNIVNSVSCYRLRFGTNSTSVTNPWNISIRQGGDIYITMADSKNNLVQGEVILEINNTFYYHNMPDYYAKRTINLAPGTYYIKAWGAKNSEFICSGVCRLTVTS